MTPDAVIEHFKQGSLRFRKNGPTKPDYLAQRHNRISGQHPAAVILSCIDAHAPAEILLDAGLGEAFHFRVAGNTSDHDVLSNMEFACKIAGVKVIVVMGHTCCAAVREAIDNFELSGLTASLRKIKAAIGQTVCCGERTSNNDDFVDAVARRNVELTIENIRGNSAILKALEDQQKIKIVGSMYHRIDGEVEFFEG